MTDTECLIFSLIALSIGVAAMFVEKYLHDKKQKED